MTRHRKSNHNISKHFKHFSKKIVKYIFYSFIIIMFYYHVSIKESYAQNLTVEVQSKAVDNKKGEVSAQIEKIASKKTIIPGLSIVVSPDESIVERIIAAENSVIIKHIKIYKNGYWLLGRLKEGTTVPEGGAGRTWTTEGGIPIPIPMPKIPSPGEGMEDGTPPYIFGVGNIDDNPLDSLGIEFANFALVIERAMQSGKAGPNPYGGVNPLYTSLGGISEVTFWDAVEGLALATGTAAAWIAVGVATSGVGFLLAGVGAVTGTLLTAKKGVDEIEEHTKEQLEKQWKKEEEEESKKGTSERSLEGINGDRGRLPISQQFRLYISAKAAKYYSEKEDKVSGARPIDPLKEKEQGDNLLRNEGIIYSAIHTSTEQRHSFKGESPGAALGVKESEGILSFQTKYFWGFVDPANISDSIERLNQIKTTDSDKQNTN